MQGTATEPQWSVPVYVCCPHISLFPYVYSLSSLSDPSPSLPLLPSLSILSLVACQNALPLHPMRSPRHPKAAILLCLKAAPGSLRNWITVVGPIPWCVAEGSYDGSGRARQGVVWGSPVSPCVRALSQRANELSSLNLIRIKNKGELWSKRVVPLSFTSVILQI